MNKSIIRYLLCRVLQFEALFMLLPVVVSIFYKEKTGLYFLAIAAVAFLVGTLGGIKKPSSSVFYAREGFVTVSLSWILLSLVGAIPFTVTGEIPNYIDAFFETASGYTTTGASILTNVELMSQTCMFWRCFTNWVGGMGVLVFIMAILPLSGSYNMHLMRAESPGPDVGKLVPKVRDTAKILYLIYIGLTVILIISYMIAGMSVYNAFIISFSTMGTGGFANLNASVGGYNHAVQVIAVVFMLMCGVNFNAYYLILKGKLRDFFKIEEVRVYLIIVAIGTLGITVQIRSMYGSWYEAFHHAIFQLASIISTTGFASADFDVWPMLSKGILLFAMVVGGCAGATSGGVKVSRVIILCKSLNKELGHLTHPRSVKKIHMSGETVNEETVRSVLSFIVAYVVIVMISVLLISVDNMDITTSISSVLATVGNVGPGFSVVGATGNYSTFSAFSKIILSFDMLAGRLELFPMLVLFYPGTWRKS